MRPTIHGGEKSKQISRVRKDFSSTNRFFRTLLEKLVAHTVKPDTRELRHFGFLLGALVVAIFAGIPFFRRHVMLGWPWLVAVALWLPALIAPAALGYLHRGWTQLGGALGWFNTRVILSLLYVIAVVPIGLIMRLIGRDPMARKYDPALDSYRVPSKQRPSSHLEQPF